MKKIVLMIFIICSSLFSFEHLTKDNFDEKLKDKNVIVDFYATWCPPCKVLAERLEIFDKVKPTNVTIYKVDVEKSVELAKKYNVSVLPTVVYFKNGKMLQKDPGMKYVEELIENSKKYFE
ncbi:thioredoxin [Halarcobacter ebronensis]|uniref:Thioredoxin n=1 Tax=Halarcobacter ebronensis TaxID=1462615 RepID=A0A4Q0Y8U5_9BACT|nr:thioredoxin domain-containing protein [Halarcobacter ebronensis]RXJ66652.1 thioredoxin [Halarcobacter ebronensis]